MMLELDRLALGQDPGAALPPVSAVAAPGRPGVVGVETESAPTIAALIAGGRMEADSGRLLVDGVADAARVRRTTALVDTPGVAEPFPVMTVRRVVREELAYAGERASRSAVETVVDAVGLTRHADTPIERIPTALRVRLLVELALLRPGIEALVVTSPERHGGSVPEWFAVLQEVADRGVAVLVITSMAAAETIDALIASGSEPDDADTDTEALARHHHAPAHRQPDADPDPDPDADPDAGAGSAPAKAPVTTGAEPSLQAVAPAAAPDASPPAQAEPSLPTDPAAPSTQESTHS
ncbi:hypothetical protein [Curtobacterium sp. Leaf261]|uniref:hypothetical protein n=1 Tax=Curtobacterium sp. Leaf261 TaxID=1736311 RepID=UPI0006FBC302|nr:hypothetical protein [Curtobacterium sp. Leaf261]KQO61434.1 hypothetical protein ASF23_13275 [Curtobacterium sp. Leaf261]